MAAVELYLVRHAIAEPPGEAWPDDAKRPLTEEGIARFRKVVRGLSMLGVDVPVVLTSPLVRAKQTAELLAAGLEQRPHVATIESLAPGGTYAAVLADLEKHARRGAIALVGHEPALGELAARLAGSKTPLAFKKGGVCRIDVDALPPSAPGTLKWFAPPKMLRKLR